MRKEDTPCILILDPSGIDYIKYRWSGEIESLSVRDLKAFIKDFRDEKLDPYYRSEPIPVEQGSLTTLVGINWKEIV